MCKYFQITGRYRYIPRPYIISIVGIPGSGKSYVCRELNKQNIPCIDTDRVLCGAFTKLLENKTLKKHLAVPGKYPMCYPESFRKLVDVQARKDLQAEINKIKGPLVVVVGITINVKSDLRFFIKLHTTYLEKMYRRTMLREADKIKNNYTAIQKIINSAPVYNISGLLHFVYEIDAINQALPFAGRKL